MLTWSAKQHSKSTDYLGILGMILEPKDVGTLLHKVFKICCAAIHALVCEVPKPFLQIGMQADSNTSVQMAHVGEDCSAKQTRKPWGRVKPAGTSS